MAEDAPALVEGGKKKKRPQDEDRVMVTVRIRPVVRNDEDGSEEAVGLQYDVNDGIIWCLHQEEGRDGKAKEGPAVPKQFVFDYVKPQVKPITVICVVTGKLVLDSIGSHRLSHCRHDSARLLKMKCIKRVASMWRLLVWRVTPVV